MNMLYTELETRRKKLLWRANHRGMKELDLMLGGFADKMLGTMSVGELDEFEAILDTSDVLLADWLTGKGEIPAEVNSKLLSSIKNQSFVPDDYKSL